MRTYLKTCACGDTYLCRKDRSYNKCNKCSKQAKKDGVPPDRVGVGRHTKTQKTCACGTKFLCEKRRHNQDLCKKCSNKAGAKKRVKKKKVVAPADLGTKAQREAVDLRQIVDDEWKHINNLAIALRRAIEAISEMGGSYETVQYLRRIFHEDGPDWAREGQNDCT